MNKKFLLMQVLMIIFISCSRNISVGNLESITNLLSNKDHVIKLKDGKTYYAFYKSFNCFDLYSFEENQFCIKTENSFINKRNIKKILINMSKEEVISILGVPAIQEPNRFIYFQNYVDIHAFKINYGIDRRIFEIEFFNDQIIHYGEKYVSRI